MWRNRRKERQNWRGKEGVEGCDERPRRRGVSAGWSTEWKTGETCTYERTMESYFKQKERVKMLRAEAPLKSALWTQRVLFPLVFHGSLLSVFSCVHLCFWRWGVTLRASLFASKSAIYTPYFSAHTKSQGKVNNVRSQNLFFTSVMHPDNFHFSVFVTILIG